MKHLPKSDLDTAPGWDEDAMDEVTEYEECDWESELDDSPDDQGEEE